jgi:hypothetical protein
VTPESTDPSHCPAHTRRRRRPFAAGRDGPRRGATEKRPGDASPGGPVPHLCVPFVLARNPACRLDSSDHRRGSDEASRGRRNEPEPGRHRRASPSLSPTAEHTVASLDSARPRGSVGEHLLGTADGEPLGAPGGLVFRVPGNSAQLDSGHGHPGCGCGFPVPEAVSAPMAAATLRTTLRVSPWRGNPACGRTSHSFRSPLPTRDQKGGL